MMKFIMAASVLLAASISKADDVKNDAQGIYETKGQLQLSIYKAYPNETHFTITGTPAKVLWDITFKNRAKGEVE